MPVPDDDLLRHYLEELSWLRSMGARFASAHPDVAGKLEINANVCPDPNVERLLESFAFLTARIQSDLSSDYPEIAAELLRTLCPHYLNPIPSMTIVRFEADAKPARVERNTQLFLDTTAGDVCRFRTCYPADVWPLAVEDVDVLDGLDFEYPHGRRPAAAVLRLRLRTTAKPPLQELGIDTLRFFINNDRIVDSLYPLLLGGDRRRVAVVGRNETRIPNALLEIAQVGFAEDEDVIPYPRTSHPAYRLLDEYFMFEQKFHFFDVRGLAGRLNGKDADLLFLLDAPPAARAVLHRDDFVLGCAPAVNIFSRTSEPIRVNHRSLEYPLIADHRRHASTAIHSIVSVSGSSDAKQQSRTYAPFYSYTHDMGLGSQSAFWHARRDGDDVRLSFRDTNFDVTKPADEIVYAHLLCTNGDYAAEMPAGCALYCDQDLSVGRITSIRKPTKQLRPAQGGELLSKLVSHLSLNYLSLEDEEPARRALREILLLYCPPGATAQRRRIDGIRRVTSRKVTRRAEEWRGFVRGTEITLELEDALLDRDNGFLFASVLSHFFGLHASINSFSQLVVKGDASGTSRFRETKGIQWPIMTGFKAVL